MDSHDESDEDFPSPTKKKVRLKPSQNENKCWIHCSNDSGKLYSPQSLESWQVLLSAAVIRKNTALLDIASDISTVSDLSVVKYHRNCRSVFTMKSKLNLLDQDNLNADSEAHSSTQSTENIGTDNRRSSRSSDKKWAGDLLPAICIFCEKKSKYSSVTRTREELSTCVDERADARIKQVAIEIGDDRVIALLSTGHDAMSAEAQYHRTCYKKYTRQSIGATDENDSSSYTVTGYQTFFNYIDNLLLTGANNIYQFSDITNQFEMFMTSAGALQAIDSRKKNLRRVLENKYESKILFVETPNGRLLVCSSSLSREELIVQNFDMMQRLKKYDKQQQSDIILTAGKIIRNDICALKNNINPVAPGSLPTSCKYFLGMLLTGKRNEAMYSRRVRRLTWSYGQDLIHSVSNARIKTPKHVALPFVVKTLTGNVKLIEYLNRLGHCLSYSQIEEIDTSIALTKILNSDDRRIALPRGIQPSTFTHLAWDNIDRLEEILTGAGTTHRVNGIIVQPGVRPSDDVSFVINKQKIRSLDLLSGTDFLPSYISGSRVGPNTFLSMQPDYSSEIVRGRSLTLLWVIQRYNNQSDQTVPSWTGFNITSRCDIVIEESTLGYLPTVNYPATDMSTVSEVMQRSMLIKNSLNLKSICCTFDQALYAKAAEIVWKHNEQYEGIILLLGDFHLVCNFLSIIGKRFSDAGLRDIVVESGVIAQGSVESMLAGKHYNRGIRAHKIVYEGLMRILLTGFKEYLVQHNETTLLEGFKNYVDIDSTCQEEIFKKFDDYKNEIRESHGPTASLWLSYIDMIDVLLNHIRSVREGNWPLYLATLRQILPWFFSYDHINYARYAPVYYFDMLNLQTKFPDVYESFTKGYFSVQLRSTSPFSRLPVDEVIEKTVNLDTQTAGGTKGFSRKSKTVEKYYLTCDARSLFTRYLNEVSEAGYRRQKHADLLPSRIKRDERDVKAIVNVLTQDWLNPFLSATEMIIVSTGVSVPISVSNDLLNAYSKGDDAFQSFSSEVLKHNAPSEHFYDRMTKMKLKTCKDVNKKKKIQVSGREIALRADRNLFAKMAIIAQKRNLDMRTVLSFPLGPIPLSIGNTDGSMRKTKKSSLLTALTNNIEEAEIISGREASIIDGMCLVRRVVNVPETFGQLAEALLSMLLAKGNLSERIDVVFDVYRDISIKSAERLRRADHSATKTYQTIASNHKITDWRCFLTSGSNKSVLVQFLFDYWSQPRVTTKLKKDILVTVNSACFRLSSVGAVEVVELISEQEEADTRVLLHAKHASESGFSRVVIHADDTDIGVIALSFIPDICAKGTVLYMKSGTQNRIKYINLSALHNKLGKQICDALIGFHALTGCDTVSSFCGRGKVKAYNCLKRNLHLASSLSLLGQGFQVSDDVYTDIEQYVCCLYGYSQSKSVDDVRFGLFCGKKGSVECHNLPPCQNTLRLHISRANYQAGIWRRALDPNPEVPSANGFGWTVTDNIVKIVWMSCSPAPDSILEFMSCNCARDCVAPSCTCITHGLPCTDMCRKSDCSNTRDLDVQSTKTHLNINDSSDSESDLSSDDERNIEDIDPQDIEEDCEIDNVINILSDEDFFAGQ